MIPFLWEPQWGFLLVPGSFCLQSHNSETPQHKETLKLGQRSSKNDFRSKKKTNINA